MGELIRFPKVSPRRLDFARAKRHSDPTDFGQLSLFSEPTGDLILFPHRLGKFERAVLLDERDPVAAAQLYREAISDGDYVADAYCNLGILETREARVDEALDCFTRALVFHPRHLEAHYNLANLYVDLGNIRLARAHYLLVTRIDPDFSNAYFNLGLVQTMMGEFSSAICSLEQFKRLADPLDISKAEELIRKLKEVLPADSN